MQKRRRVGFFSALRRWLIRLLQEKKSREVSYPCFGGLTQLEVIARSIEERDSGKLSQAKREVEIAKEADNIDKETDIIDRFKNYQKSKEITYEQLFEDDKQFSGTNLSRGRGGRKSKK